MSNFREQDFLKSEDVTLNKVFEICQNAYLNVKNSESEHGNYIIVDENNVRILIEKNNDDSIKLLCINSFGFIEVNKKTEFESLALKICNKINEDWRMVNTYYSISDNEPLITISSYEMFFDRGLHIPQLVSNIKRFSSILNSITREDNLFQELFQE